MRWLFTWRPKHSFTNGFLFQIISSAAINLGMKRPGSHMEETIKINSNIYNYMSLYNIINKLSYDVIAL